jgi:hypothetical protein
MTALTGNRDKRHTNFAVNHTAPTTTIWVFPSWKSEQETGPRIGKAQVQPDQIETTFSENVTVATHGAVNR